MFFESADQQLRAFGIDIGSETNCRPDLQVGENDREAYQSTIAQYPRPWVFVCPRSDSYNVRQVPDGIWQAAAAKIHGTKFWVGRHPAPGNFIDLKCQHFDRVIGYLSVADLLVSVDTGPLHVAAALGIPCVAIGQSSSPDLHLSDQRDFVTIQPPLECLNCQENICRMNQWIPLCQNIDPELIAAWSNARLGSRFGNDCSAVVAIYKPDVNTLNRCLECLLPQVQEIIVTGEANSIKPHGAIENGKIRYVRKNLANIGYGRNANYGVRNSNGKWILLMNDDVFLDPGAVERMQKEIAPGVGLVSNFLRYPDGTIYHAGKVRHPGVRGWGHIDHRGRNPSITNTTEMENTCMACALVPREAFYKIGGFDEDFFLFAEDDDFCLRLRKAGYRILFTPHSTGIHMEHQSVKKVSDIADLVRRANDTFHRKWGGYLDHNLNRIPGTFDYLTAR